MIKRIITLSLTAIACLTMQAQTNNDVVTLAKSSGYWVAKPSVAIDKKKKSVARWNRTEKDDWFEPSGLVVENVPTVDLNDELFADFVNASKDAPYTPMPWKLTEENGETVLHCYLPMPADIVDNFPIATTNALESRARKERCSTSRFSSPNCPRPLRTLPSMAYPTGS